MVARDQANQGAAVLLTSVGKARALGVPEDRLVYLHGGADVRERHADGAGRPVAQARLRSLACRRALEVAGLDAGRARRASTSTAASRSRCSTSATAWAWRRTIRAA